MKSLFLLVPKTVLLEGKLLIHTQHSLPPARGTGQNHHLPPTETESFLRILLLVPPPAPGTLSTRVLPHAPEVLEDVDPLLLSKLWAEVAY